MRLLIVPCTFRKIWDEQPSIGTVAAKDAYRYEGFASWRRAAEASGSPWLVFSTKYGLIDPDTPIDRYDTGAAQARRDPQFGQMVSEQAATLLAGASEIVMVGENKAMLELLRDVLPDFADRMHLE